MNIKGLFSPLLQLMDAAANLPQDIDSVLKKQGFKRRKTEADVDAMAAAIEKRERRAERNRRNAQRMAEGMARRNGGRA